MENTEENATKKKQSLPLLEVAAGGVVGIAAGLITFKKLGDVLQAKFPEINEKLGLDIKTSADFKNYYDEANKWTNNNTYFTREAEKIRTIQIERFNVLKEYKPSVEWLYVSAGAAVVAAAVVGCGIFIAKEMNKQPEPQPDNNIMKPSLQSKETVTDLLSQTHAKK